MWWCERAAGLTLPTHPTRRRLLALLPAAALAGCGFTLRRAPELPFQRIALLGFATRSPLADELRRSLADAAVQVVDTPGQADVALHALTEKRTKAVVASTAAGQVRDMTLRLIFNYRLATPGGHALIAATEISLSRDMSYSETTALAKTQEEAELYAAMQADIVQQVLRRLARVAIPAELAPKTPAASSPQGGSAGLGRPGAD